MMKFHNIAKLAAGWCHVLIQTLAWGCGSTSTHWRVSVAEWHTGSRCPDSRREGRGSGAPPGWWRRGVEVPLTSRYFSPSPPLLWWPPCWWRPSSEGKTQRTHLYSQKENATRNQLCLLPVHQAGPKWSFGRTFPTLKEANPCRNSVHPHNR